tara:strand:+ start:6443 stop:8575 length:2133 start_codon:yes stop_codon:yes gene_type:complete
MREQFQISTGRLWLIFVVLSFVAIGIFARIFVIQIAEHDKWEAKGNDFAQRVRTIEPARGQILSKNGSLLAISIPVYDLRWDSQSPAIDWSEFDENLEAVCIGLSTILGESKEYYATLFNKARGNKSQAQLFAKRIPYSSYKDIKSLPFIKQGRYQSGFVFERKEIRKKPFNELASRTIGIERSANRVGIERSWNPELGGVLGQQMQKKVLGGVWITVGDEFISEPEDGLDVTTTIDMHLQDVASTSLEKQLIKHDAKWGVVVLMEVETGYVRAISNLEKHESKNGDSYYSESYNHALASAEEPGSTFKLASIMACLESGEISIDDIIDTKDGVATFHNRKMKDSNWQHGGHGEVTLKEVFTMSSNIGSALAVKRCFSLYPQRFLDELQKIGITQPLGVNLVGEGNPQIYTSVGEGGWSGLSLTQMAIGYEVTQTPLQILSLYSAVANDGVMMRPVFVTETSKRGETVESFGPVVLNDKICSAKTLYDCKLMLESVCEPGGEGTAAEVFENSPYTVAGKTGTAKIAHNGSYADGRYRASFTGYFPADNPQYACVVVISDTKSGSYYGSTIAAPVFRDLADLIYATDPSFHEVLDMPLLAENKRHLPTANNGVRSEIIYLYDKLGIPYEDLSDKSDWVRISTDSTSVLLNTRTITNQTMPNVMGMGLKDALYLLENAGIKVEYIGTGFVREQTIAPGTPFEQASSIILVLS